MSSRPACRALKQRWMCHDDSSMGIIRGREAEMVRACQLANEDPEVAAIELEMDGLEDTIEEPWDECPPR